MARHYPEVFWPLLILAFATSGAAQEAPQVIRGPYLQSLLSTSVVVVWVTDLPTSGVVRCSSGDGERVHVEAPLRDRVHALEIPNLTPDTVYSYEVLDGERLLTEGEGFQFRTAPPTGEGMARFVALGDSGTGGAQQAAIAEILCQLEPDVFLHTGDLTYIQDLDRALFSPYRSTLASSCLFPARGNHDIQLPWSQLFVVPAPEPAVPSPEVNEDTGTYYSFDWGSAHFVVLDTTLPLVPDSEQLIWLEEDLQSSRDLGQDWVIAYFHHPPYNIGVHTDSSPFVRTPLTPFFDRHRVDLVLSGHDHNYQRTHPIRADIVRDAWQDPDFVSPAGTIYVVTGGGGQILYDPQARASRVHHRVFQQEFHVVELEIHPEVLTARAVGRDGETLDRFSLRKGPRPTLEFVRSDVDFDQEVTITDPINLLTHLFATTRIECPAAGSIEPGTLPSIGDSVFVLNYLFLNGPTPPSPFPGCGSAPEDDDAFCMRSGCEEG